MSASFATSTPKISENYDFVNGVTKKMKKKKVKKLEHAHCNPLEENPVHCDGEINNEADDEDHNEINNQEADCRNKQLEHVALTIDERNTLIERIQSAIPANDVLPYKSRLAKLDWNLIKFDDYTAEDCRYIWSRIMSKIRKLRTLNEIVEDVKVMPIMKGSGELTKPLSSFMLFYMDMKDEVMRKYPGISAPDIAMRVSKRYKKLNAEELERYKEKARALREQYDLKNNPLGRKPKTAFQLFRDQYLEKYQNDPNYDKGKYLIKCKKRWNKLDESKKVVWIELAQSREEEYKQNLKEYEQGHPSFMVSQMKTVITKTERNVLDKRSGKPEKPPSSAYSLYSRELLRGEHLKAIPSNERMAEISKRWKALSDADRATYVNHVKQLQEEYKADLARYIDSLPSPKKEEERAKMKTTKKKTVVSNENENGKKVPKNTASVKRSAPLLSNKDEHDHSSEDEPLHFSHPKKEKLNKVFQTETLSNRLTSSMPEQALNDDHINEKIEPADITTRKKKRKRKLISPARKDDQQLDDEYMEFEDIVDQKTKKGKVIIQSEELTANENLNELGMTNRKITKKKKKRNIDGET